MTKLTEEMVIARSKQSDLASIKKLNCWWVFSFMIFNLNLNFQLRFILIHRYSFIHSFILKSIFAVFFSALHSLMIVWWRKASKGKLLLPSGCILQGCNLYRLTRLRYSKPNLLVKLKLLLQILCVFFILVIISKVYGDLLKHCKWVKFLRKLDEYLASAFLY